MPDTRPTFTRGQGCPAMKQFPFASSGPDPEIAAGLATETDAATMRPSTRELDTTGDCAAGPTEPSIGTAETGRTQRRVDSGLLRARPISAVPPNLTKQLPRKDVNHAWTVDPRR